MDGNLTPVSGSASYPANTCHNLQPKKIEPEVCEAEQLSISEMSTEERATLQSYMNTTLEHIDQLRYPQCLPSLEGDHGNAGEHQASAQESSEHPAAAHSESHESHETHGKDHGGGSSTYIEGVKITKFGHKGIEFGLEGLGYGEPGAAEAPLLEAGAGVPKPASTVAKPLMSTTAAKPLPALAHATKPLPSIAPAASQASSTNAVASVSGAAPGAESASLVSSTSSTIKAPLKQPVSWDMQEMVDNIRRTQAELSAPAKAVPKTPVPSESIPPAPKIKPSVTATGESSVAGASETATATSQGGKLHKTLEGANKVIGPLAVVAGGLEVAHGVHELKTGKTVEGVLDVGGGVAATTSGVAATTAAYSSTTAVAGIGLGAIAAGGAGVAAMADGVKGIYQGVKNKDVEQGVVGGVKTAAGAAMLAGACTGNPILVAGGAVTYVGAVVYENREAIANGAKTAYNATANALGSAYDATSNAIGSAADKAGGAIKGAWNWATSWY